MQKINFYFLDRKPALKHRKDLKQFIEGIFKKEKKKLESLSCIFCSDEHLLGMNKFFLQHDFYTDVITFELGLNGTGVAGEVYLSVDRIKENAKMERVSFNKELHRVIFHGVLHLCGFKDKTKASKKIMRMVENKYLDLYFM